MPTVIFVLLPDSGEFSQVRLKIVFAEYKFANGLQLDHAFLSESLYLRFTSKPCGKRQAIYSIL